MLIMKRIKFTDFERIISLEHLCRYINACSNNKYQALTLFVFFRLQKYHKTNCEMAFCKACKKGMEFALGGILFDYYGGILWDYYLHARKNTTGFCNLFVRVFLFLLLQLLHRALN